MPFLDLPTGLQTVMLYNFEVFIKVWWITLLFVVSIIYLWYVRPREQETPFKSVAAMRGIIHMFSIINLIVSPLLFLGMHPLWDGYAFTGTYLALYVIFIIIYMIVLYRDLLMMGIPILFRLGGLKLGDEKAQLAYRKLFKRSYNGKG